MLKALLLAMLEPTHLLRAQEAVGDLTSRLATLEEDKSLPWGVVWDEYCRRHEVPDGSGWLAEIKAYERDVLAGRG
jgi:L-rhamnose isomerase